MTNLFTKHPQSVGETYFEHCCNAIRFAFVMIAAGALCFIHAFLPFLFKNTVSNRIERLNKEIKREG